MKTLLVLLASVAISQGQVTLSGKCRNEHVVKDFDVEKYSGLWYEVYRYEQEFELAAECVTARYTLTNGTVEVFNSQTSNGTRATISGVARLAPDAEGSAKLHVQFPSIGNRLANYWVLSTDYSNHALVYSCRDAGENTIKVSSWILSRTPTLAPQKIVALNPVVEAAQGLKWEHYRETRHCENDCKISP